MLASELVKISNFNHYYFIISKDYVKQDEIEFEEKLQKGVGCGTLYFYVNQKNADIDANRFYDIGYSFQQMANCNLNANFVAKHIDKMCYAGTKTKIFKIRRLEQYNGIAYIHLILNKVGK